MEPDRFQRSQGLFVLGIISLALCLVFFAFSLYLMPNLIFGFIYNVPDFIYKWRDILSTQYQFSGSGASFFIFFGFFITALGFALIAYFTSNYIDNDIFSEELPKTPESIKKPKEIGESISLFMKILLIAFLVFFVTGLVEWIIYIPPTAE